jgi:hypothetical protein
MQGDVVGFKHLVKKGETTQYLGFPFGYTIIQEEKDAKSFNQIKKILVKLGR